MHTNGVNSLTGKVADCDSAGCEFEPRFTPQIMKYPTEKQIKLFWNKVDKSSYCWIHQGKTISKNGYVQFKYRHNGEQIFIQTHRMSWILKNGKIPSDLLVLHRCDVRKCVNPDHLFLGSHQDNMDDMHKKGRANIAPLLTSNGSFYAQSDEVKIKRTLTFKKIKHQQGMNNSQYGTCWINLNEVEKKIKKEDLPQYSEWNRGRVTIRK